MTDESPIAWRAIVYGSPVLATDGTKIGSVREVLGSDSDDVFHGIRVEMDGNVRNDVVITADDVTAITRSGITTSLAVAEAAALPHYTEEATYHLASVGWLRKHLGWRADAKSDEEPG